MLSCLNPSPLFVWTGPINIESFFSLAIKIRIGHIFLCQPFPLHIKTCVGHTHRCMETHAEPDITLCLHAEAHIGYIVFSPKLITLNTKTLRPCHCPKLEVLKGFFLAGPMIHRRLPCCSYDTWDAGCAVLSRDNTIRWFLSESLALLCFWYKTFFKLFLGSGAERCNSVATKPI